MTNTFIVELDPNKRDEIEESMLLTGAKSKEELIGYALQIVKWITEHRKMGEIIAAVDERNDSYTELILPSMDNFEN
jgi:hypothetical protein